MDIKSLREFLPSFEEQCCKPPNTIPFEIKGITNVEAFYWWSIVGHYKPDIILESGVYKGRSTHILAKAQEYFKIPQHFAFEIESTYEDHVRNKLKEFKTIYSIEDSVKGFTRVLKDNPDAKVTAFVDGPKYGEPFINIFKVLSQHPGLCSIASHDCYPNSVTKEAFTYCMKKFFVNKEPIFTSRKTNKDLLFLNKYIQEDFDSFFSKRKDEDDKNSFNNVGLFLA